MTKITNKKEAVAYRRATNAFCNLVLVICNLVLEICDFRLWR